MLEVQLFGVFRAWDRDVGPLPLESHKARELLCFLLLHHDEPQSREVLASQLCGAGTTAQSLKGLRQALWHLQLGLPPGLRADLVHAEDDWVELRRLPGLECDALQFSEAVGALRGRAGAGLTPAEARALRDAEGLYRADLLVGWMHDWCLAERERLHTLHLAALEKVADHAEARRDWETALEYARRLLAFDQTSETTHRQVMRLLFCSGRRSDALRQFARCEQALREELGVGPSRATLALHECIREDRALEVLETPPTRPAGWVAPPDLAWDLVQELRGVVRDLQALLVTERRLRDEA